MLRARSHTLLLVAAGLVAALFVLLTLSVDAASTPSRAGRPTLGTLTYLGLAQDRVGREAVAKPNGERDGHFRAVLRIPSRIVLVDMVLQRVFTKGYAEGWDTNPGTSASHLGVYLNGRRLNATDRDLNRTLAPGRYRLDVYANELGTFTPGQLFKLTAQFPNYVVAASRALRLPGAVPTVTASFAGLSGDVVGAGTDQKPNGQTDAHFVASLDVHGAWQIITNVSLRRLTAGGAPDVPIYWMQGPQTAGLFVNGKRVKWPTAMPWWISVYVPVDPAAGRVKLDIYANDPGATGQESELFGSGRLYRVSVDFTDTQLLTHGTSTVVRIP